MVEAGLWQTEPYIQSTGQPIETVKKNNTMNSKLILTVTDISLRLLDSVDNRDCNMASMSLGVFSLIVSSE